MNRTLPTIPKKAYCPPVLFFLPFFLFVLPLFGGTLSAQVDEDLLTRLKTEGYAAMRDQEKKTENVHLTWLLNHPARKERFELYQEGDDYLVIGNTRPVGEEESSPSEFRAVKNQNYFFEIHTREKLPWKIREYRRIQSGDGREGGFATLRKLFPYYIAYHSLSDLIGNERLHTTRLELVPGTSEETILLEFDGVSEEVLGGGNLHLKSGRITLLPARNWAMGKYTLCLEGEQSSYEQRCTFTFNDEPVATFPVKRVHTDIVTHTDDEAKSETDSYDEEIITCDGERIPQKALHLKYYGLSKPDLRSPAEKMISRIILVAGGVLILFGLRKKYKTLRRYGKKRNRR